MRESKACMHGYYRISCQNNILFATLKGAWNEDTAHAYCQDFKLEAEALTNNNWGHLVYLADWEMGVPGVDKILEPLLFWCIENKLTHAAHVMGASRITKKYAAKIVQERDPVFTKGVFHDEAEAVSWLASMGYSPK
ncbi:hypothetical protein tloyanaT_00410 [Thalassotalea loyana]|uniref:STAS/SEC14 domain-containing protein n=1 Tax=Thalassotalea loyana TaxID=280483 RepID=A0ABQ6H743_9GAMM|nr:hypothetical protein [Thalassotalea loyana]GLX83789.1 hypothetical protein tloyanaT_00410 [Thalassotalea loyana]